MSQKTLPRHIASSTCAVEVPELAGLDLGRHDSYKDHATVVLPLTGVRGVGPLITELARPGTLLPAEGEARSNSPRLLNKRS